MDYQTAHDTGEYLGHGIADDGRSYSGYMLHDTVRYFYNDNFEEILEGERNE